jgi:UDP-2-acetamido-3-amino-2,3-dideoxy-glucuronate N-acetyltransferase
MSTTPYFKHESAYVDDGASVGEGSRIWHFCHVQSGARIGRGCVLGQNVYVAATAILGDGVRVQNNVSIYDGVVLEDGVFVGPSAVFTNVRNPRAEVSRKHAFATTRIRRGATIGANATIVCDRTLGEYAFVGAGAVITRDVPSFALCVGSPARQVGWVCRCGEVLRAASSLVDFALRTDYACSHCGSRYRQEQGELCPL